MDAPQPPTPPPQGFKTGDLILEEMPFMYSLSNSFSDLYCSGCFMPSHQTSRSSCSKEKLFKCGRCGLFSYCSRECQRFDWQNFHRHECIFYTKHSEEKIPSNILFRVALRCLVLLQHRPEEFKREFVALSGETTSFMQLLDYEGVRKNDPDLVRVLEDLFVFLDKTQLEYDEDQLKRTLFKYLAHCFDILDPERLAPIGSAVYLRTICLTHSCRPNAGYTYNGLKIRISALKDISPDEPVCISFGDDLMTKSMRQNLLRSRFCIECTCTRCTEEDKVDEELCDQIVRANRSLREKFKSACQGQIEWYRPFKLAEQLMGLIEKAMGKYHPVISFHKYFYFHWKINCRQRSKISLEDVLESLTITHGPDHPMVRNINKLASDIEYRNEMDLIARMKQMKFF